MIDYAPAPPDHQTVAIEDRDYWLDIPEYRRLVGAPARRRGRTAPSLPNVVRDLKTWKPTEAHVQPAGKPIPEGIDLHGLLRTSQPD